MFNIGFIFSIKWSDLLNQKFKIMGCLLTFQSILEKWQAFMVANCLVATSCYAVFWYSEKDGSWSLGSIGDRSYSQLFLLSFLSHKEELWKRSRNDMHIFKQVC